MTRAIKKGRLEYQDGVVTHMVVLKTGETLSVKNFIALRNSEGFPFEETVAELEQVFGKMYFPAEGEGAAQGAQEAKPSFKKVSLESILSVELAPPAFAIEQLAPEGEVTLLGGHGGAGKTIFALTLAAHFAAGVPWSGFKPKGGRALFVSLEDPASLMQFRLKKIIETYGLPAELVEKNLTILDGSDSGGVLMAESSNFGLKTLTRTSLFDELEKAAEDGGLIIVDNCSDAFSGDENSRRQARTFVRELRAVAKKNQAGLILLAHIDKAAARYGSLGNSYSGSTAWHNSVRSRLALLEKDGAVELIQEKLNTGKKLDRAIRLTWAEGVLMPDAASGGRLDVEGQDADRFAVLMAVQKVIADGTDVPTARTGPKTAHGTLERFPDLPSALRGRSGRDAFYLALSELQREGVLQVEEYTTPSRNIRQRFCVGSGLLHNTPTPLSVELTKLTQGVSSVAGIASVAGTNETNETNAKWVFKLPDGTVCHTQPRDTTQDILL